MNKKLKNKKGITLVALIITIIVLLILAVVAITSISNSNIIKHAQNARDNYSIEDEKEKVSLAVHEAMLDGKGKITEDGITKGMETYFGEEGLNWRKVSSDDANVIIVEIGKKENTNNRKYKITLSTGTVEKVTEGSTSGGESQTEKVKIGDKVNYQVEGYNGEWRVLNTDDNQIKIVATSNAETMKISGSDKTLGKWDDETSSYKNAENELNKVCKKYINEKYATESRSIKTSDINKLMNFNETGYKEGNEEDDFKYGDIVTYKLEDGKVQSKVNSSDTWFSTNQKVLLKPLEDKDIEGDYSVKYTFYDYTITKNNENNIHKMFFENNEAYEAYWLASSYVKTSSRAVVYGMFHVSNVSWCYGVLGTGGSLWTSSSYSNQSEMEMGVRPVVTLKTDVELIQTAEDSEEWNLRVK